MCSCCRKQCGVPSIWEAVRKGKPEFPENHVQGFGLHIEETILNVKRYSKYNFMLL